MRVLTLASLAAVLLTAVLLAIAPAQVLAGLGGGEVYAPETDAADVDAPEVNAPEVDKPYVDAPELDMGATNQGPAVTVPAMDQPGAQPSPDAAVGDLLPAEDDGVVHELRDTGEPPPE